MPTYSPNLPDRTASCSNRCSLLEPGGKASSACLSITPTGYRSNAGSSGGYETERLRYTYRPHKYARQQHADRQIRLQCRVNDTRSRTVH